MKIKDKKAAILFGIWSLLGVWGSVLYKINGRVPYLAYLALLIITLETLGREAFTWKKK